MAGEWLATKSVAAPSDVEQAEQRLQLAIAIAHEQARAPSSSERPRPWRG